MSRKWKVIGSFLCFVVLLSGLFFVSLHQTRLRDDYANTSPEEKLSFSDIQVVVCGLEDTQLIYKPHSLSAASLITFLQASTANQVSQNYKHQVVFKPKHILNGLSDLRYYLYLLSLSTITIYYHSTATAFLEGVSTQRRKTNNTIKDKNSSLRLLQCHLVRKMKSRKMLATGKNISYLHTSYK